MLLIADLRTLAKERLDEAEALLKAKRYDAGIYLCGYAVEHALKARICKTLRWDGYPDTRKEFEGYSSFKVHNLGVLLSLSGKERAIKSAFMGYWMSVKTWDPSVRYRRTGATERDLQEMIGASRVLLRNLR